MNKIVLHSSFNGRILGDNEKLYYNPKHGIIS